MSIRLVRAPLTSRARIAAATSLVLFTGVLLTVSSAQAAITPRWRTPQHLTAVPTAPAPKRPPVENVAVRLAAAGKTPTAPVWPTTAAAVVDLGAPAGAASTSGADGARQTTVGGLRVSLRPAGSAAEGKRAGTSVSPEPSQVRVEVVDQQRLAGSNRLGLALRLARADGVAASGRVTVGLSYEQVAGAFGAGWAGRLRLEAVPECALTTPNLPACAGTLVPFHNDLATRTLTADLTLPAASAAESTSTVDGRRTTSQAGSVLLVASAGSSSTSGDFGSTALQPSATWSGGGSNGDFSWSYPLRTPPSLGGPTPAVAFSYSSQSVDGLTSATNNQASWLGDGFNYVPGFIERRYNACADDGQSGKFDLCWATDNATLSFAGHGGELIQISTNPDVWRPVRDDGTRVERIRDISKNNGDNDGEYWKATTADGTQYFFGRNRLPSAASGQPETNSVFYEPVAGDDTGEPCNGATYAVSFCQQAYRWNLDYVVDPYQNTMSYWYVQEINWYGQNVATAVGKYVRHGYLARIDYGTDNRTGTDTTFTGTAPARVVFTTADRCASACATHDAAHWPDVPWDQECVGTGGNPPASCASRYLPTFWTTRRLASVTTQVATGTQARKDVETWALGVQWLDPGSGDGGKIMWLNTIGHTGLNGTTPGVSVPDVVIGPTATTMLNRVHNADGYGAFNRFRIATVTTESGAVLGVAYSPPDCVWGSKMPAAPESNTYRCFPVNWTPPGGSQILDYYHKYVVTSVTVADNVGGTTTVATSYTYPTDAAAWHYDESELVPAAKKTWGQWRGYEGVTTTRGAAGGTQSQEVSKYFRGMNGDKLPAGARSKSYVVNGTTYADENWLAGMTWESITYDGVGGPVVTDRLTEPWTQGPTASRTRNGVTTAAYAVNVLRSTVLTKLDNSRPDRRSAVTYTYTDGTDGTPPGRVIAVDDEGDVSTIADDQCTRTTYARNDAGYLYSLVAQTETTGLRCSVTPTQPADVLTSQRTWYDGASSYPTTPTKGDITRTEQLKVWNANAASRQYLTTSRATFDAYGRVLDKWDVFNRKTSTAYTPAAGGPATTTVVTNPKLWTTTTVVDPAWGLATSLTDENSRVTSITYDALGRTTGVWLPGWSKATHPTLASHAYSYLVRSSDGPSVITRDTLNTNGNGYSTSFELLDGNLRPRQTQGPAVGGAGRTITDTYYDSRGLATKINAGYYATGTPGTTLQLTSDSAIPSQTRTTYDGAARPTVSALVSQSVEKWRTTTSYGGDRVDITPPAGGTATSTITDVRGQTVKLRQYNGPTPTPFTAGSYAETSYTYDHGGRKTTVVDSSGITWQWTYDQLGRQATAVDPDKGTSSFTYDDGGKTLTSTDANGALLTHVYDALDRKTALWQGAADTGTKLAAWTYDTVPDAAGLAGHAMYGQLATATRWSGGNAYVTTVPGYDAANRATGTTITIPAGETGLAGSYAFTATFNPNGSVATTTLPAIGGLPAETLTTAYGATNQPLTMKGLTDYVSDATYLETGQLTSLTNNSTVSYQQFNYDPTTMRLDSSSVQANTFPDILADVRYTYDPAGNIKSVANLLAQYGEGYGADDTQCFTYDNLRRLTEAWTPASGSCAAVPSVAGLGGAAPYWLSWSFAPTGNRTGQTLHTSGGSQSTTYTSPAATAARPHALSSTSGVTVGTYGYDAAGNTTSRPGTSTQQTLTWDPEGHLAGLTESGVTSSYVYDTMGNRLITRDATGRTLHLPFGVELHVNAADGATNATRSYGFGTNLVATRTTTGGLSWLFADHQGTGAIALRDSDMTITRRWQTPYGTLRGTATTWPNQHGYVGGFRDTSQLTHIGARDYDAATGRFISTDPIQDLSDPQQWNAYTYSNGNPVTYSDPTGLEHNAEAGPGSPPPAAGVPAFCATLTCAASFNPSIAGGTPRVYYDKSQAGFLQVDDGRGHTYKFRLNDDSVEAENIEIRNILNNGSAAAGDTNESVWRNRPADGEVIVATHEGEGSNQPKTPDLLRLEFKNGVLDRVVRVEIYEPVSTNSEAVGKIGEKQVQADEIIIRYKTPVSDSVVDRVMAATKNMSFDSRTILSGTGENTAFVAGGVRGEPITVRGTYGGGGGAGGADGPSGGRGGGGGGRIAGAASASLGVVGLFADIYFYAKYGPCGTVYGEISGACHSGGGLQNEKYFA